MSNNKQLTPVIFIIVILMSILCIVIFPTIIAAHAQYPYLPNIQTVRASNNNNNNNNGGTSEPQPKINPFGQLIGVIDGSSDSGKENKNSSNNKNSSSLNNNNKVVILNLYNTIQSQFTNAKPILDKYGFKVSFFIVCKWAGSKPSRLTWQEIEQLHISA
jgi:hypothetical protein